MALKPVDLRLLKEKGVWTPEMDEWQVQQLNQRKQMIPYLRQ